jgi:nucleolar complex protein 3
MEKLAFLAHVNSDDFSIVSKHKALKDKKAPPKKKARKEKSEDDVDAIDRDDTARKAFTKNWDQSLHMTESLPVKLTGGKIVRSMRPKSEIKKKEDSESESDDEEDEEDEGSDTSSTYDMEDEIKPDSIKPTVKAQKASFDEKRFNIAEICHSITTDPMRAFQKRRDAEAADDVRYIPELLAYFGDADLRVQEVAMLSSLLVFKDVCPAYRIRTTAEFEQGVQLKKETKKLRDFEVAVLHNYQYYVRYLEKTVTNGLGSTKRTSPLTDSNGVPTAQWELGLSALRCQCELMRGLIHFNLRSIVLTSIVARAGQHIEGVSSICCRTIRDIFVGDKEGDVIFELVGIMGKHLQACKYDVPESFMRCFEHIKFTVHADSARDIRRKAKQNRRKRKKAGDEVEAAMQESDMSAQVINAKRFQADALHEVCIIYFRYFNYDHCVHLFYFAC